MEGLDSVTRKPWASPLLVGLSGFASTEQSPFLVQWNCTKQQVKVYRARGAPSARAGEGIKVGVTGQIGGRC